MAEVTKGASPSLASVLPPPNLQEAGLVAGEALGAFDAVYVKASDKKVYKATGAAANAAARARGWVPSAYPIGAKDVTVYYGDITVNYGSGLTTGDDLFLSGTVAGGLANAASTGGTGVIAFVLDDQRVRLLNPR
jgi:hypothetical protein